jgi:hypothetical protein
MRKIQTGFAVACLIASTGSHACWSTDCDDEDGGGYSPPPSYSPSPPSGPPQVLQPIVITAPNPPPPPATLPPGWAPAPYTPPVPPPPASPPAGDPGYRAVVAEVIVNSVKDMPNYCRGRYESCSSWALRITGGSASNPTTNVCSVLYSGATVAAAHCNAIMNSIYNGTDYKWVCAQSVCGG